MNDNELIPLSSVVKQALWGGDKLYGYLNLNTDKTKISEVWALSALENNESVVMGGKYQNLKLSELYRQYPELFGHYPQENFPLLLKFIDTKKDLSIQVHPNDKYANAHGYLSGKEEMWYIIDNEEFSKIILHHDFKSKQDLVSSIKEGTILKHLNYEFTHPGETFYISPGTIHAIGSGNLLYEAQQSVNLTYRLYDYDRLDENGNKRELHIDDALEVIDYQSEDDVHIALVDKKQHSTTLNAKHFTIVIKEILNEESLNLDGYFNTIGVLKGNCYINGFDAKTGQHFIAPNLTKRITIKGTCIIAICKPI